MKRVLVRLAAVLVLLAVVTSPAWSAGLRSSHTEDEPTRITDYRADFDVDADGDLTAVETIRVDFPASPSRHGIFRFFDTWDSSAPHARRIPHDIKVTQDGRPVDVDLSWQSLHRQRVARVGDPDRYVSPGVHTYRISYRINGVLEPGNRGHTTQFHWDLVPGGWQQPIDRATLRVRLPAPAKDVVCAVDHVVEMGCRVDGQGTDRVVVHTTELNPRRPVTLRAGLDMPTPAAGDTLPWTGRWDGVLGRSLPTAIVLLVLTALAALAGWRCSRSVREDDPAFPLQYAPPKGIGPAQAAFILTEQTNREAYVASVLQAAEEGVVELTEQDSGWTIRETGKSWEGLDAGTVLIGELTRDGGTFSAREGDVDAGEKLGAAAATLAGGVREWAQSSGNVSRISGYFLALGAEALAVVATVALLIFHPGDVLLLAALPGAFVIGGLGLLVPGASTRRTRTGRELWARIGGFRRTLATPSAEARFDFSGRQDLYTAYVPWAVVFGCAEEWAQKYRTEVGVEPPLPTYFGGYATGTAMTSITSAVSSFDHTVSSAISSYEATQSSSSSGGGGISSGGGGGGGGSW